MDFIKNNPAVITGIVRSILLGAAVAIGINMTQEQEAALVIIISLAVSFVTAKLTVPKAPTANAAPASIQTPPAA